MNNFVSDLARLYPDYEDFFIKHKNELEVIMFTISQDTYFPLKHNIFNFAKTPISKIKSVLVGMDPYPSYKNIEYYETIDKKETITLSNGDTIVPEATGRSFEVRSINFWDEKFKQASLRNILKALYYYKNNTTASLADIRKSISDKNFKIANPHEWFNIMENEGVVFLNASLTVKIDKPGSHEHIWHDFMTDLIIYINEKNPDIQWILAGQNAQNRFENLVSNKILCCHPRMNDFILECPFKRVDLSWV